MSINKQIEKTDIEHVLDRPSMYLGELEQVEKKMFYHDGNSLQFGNLKFSAGLAKIFDEAITNATENYQRQPGLKTPIEVEINNKFFSIKNYGPSIAIEKQTSKIDGKQYYIPEMTFSHLRVSSNYDDTQDRYLNGQNGVGIKLTNIFSTKFEIEIVNAGRCYTQTFENNLSVINTPKITKSNSPNSVKIKCYPDFKRLGLTEIDKSNIMYLINRSFDCVLTGKDIIINKTIFKGQTFEQYAIEHAKVLLNKRGQNDREPDFKQITKTSNIIGYIVPQSQHAVYSFVNGIYTSDNGKHVENFQQQVKTLMKNDEVNPMLYLLIFIDQAVNKPIFTSQAKTKLQTKCATSYTKLIKTLLNNQDLKNLMFAKSLNKVNRLLKVKDPIYEKCMPAHKAGTAQAAKCTLFVTEGDSASGMVEQGFSILGHEYYGIFTLRGKVLNVRKASNEKIVNNVIVKNLLIQLGLELGKEATKLRYGRIVMVKDADVDGSAIMGLVYNIFYTLFPWLLKSNFFYEFTTPAFQIILKDGTKREFTTKLKFEEAVENLGNKIKFIKYMKGLGSISDVDTKRYFKEFEKHLVKISLDEPKLTEDWMYMVYDQSKTAIEQRKQWVMECDPEEVLERADGMNEIKITEFMAYDNVHFAYDSCYRAIPSIYDGLKPSYRKILYTLLNSKKPYEFQKVFVLAGDVTKFAKYMHGDASLHETIFSMMQYWMGSNNIPLLTNDGNIGNRLSLGQKHGAARYVFCMLSKIARLIFPEADDQLLEHVEEEGEEAEPKYYVPIVPLVLINGTTGIGTGFSSDIPLHNPFDCIEYIKAKLLNKPLPKINWYYPGFKGEIQQVNNGYQTTGIFRWIDPTTQRDKWYESTKIGTSGTPLDYNPCFLEITEIPIGINYKSIIEQIIKLLSGNKNTSKKDKKDEDKPKKVKYDSKYWKQILAIREDTIPGSRVDTEQIKITFKIDNPNGQLDDKFQIIPMKSVLTTTNMYAMNDKQLPEKFENIYEIIDRFYEMRYYYYELRKKYQLKQLITKCKKLNNQAKFIKAKVDGVIDTRGMKIAELNDWMVKHGFTMENNTFDYIYNFATTKRETKEEYEKLMKEYHELRGQIDKLKKMTVAEMWIPELDELTKKIEC